MKFNPVELLTVFFEPETGRRLKVGRLARSQKNEILFEYDSEFLTKKIEFSPFKLPLRPGVFIGDPAIFSGLPGVFEDSLPDGWGRLLLDRKISKMGSLPSKLGPLDRLAWVGTRSMGALVYEPERGLDTITTVNIAELASDAAKVMMSVDGPDLERLIALGGSPQGARPKVLVQLSANGKTLRQGTTEIQADFIPYLVKFRAREDEAYSGVLELAYSKMAAAAGIDIPEARLLARTKKHPGYFAIRRFDRDRTRKFHMHTLCGLMHAPHTYPSLTYRDLLEITRALTRSEAAVREMFRRACFNVFAHNRDDHTKNFSFLMHEDGSWHVSPAYDLTLSEGPGGEHALTIMGEGRNPTQSHLVELATEAGLKKPRVIIEEVRKAVDKFRLFAEEAGLPRKTRDRIFKFLK